MGKLSGDMADWIGVTCSGGSATQEANLSPLGDGVCHQDYSNPGSVSNLKAVMYGRFDSEDSMLRTLSIVKPSFLIRDSVDIAMVRASCRSTHTPP